MFKISDAFDPTSLESPEETLWNHIKTSYDIDEESIVKQLVEIEEQFYLHNHKITQIEETAECLINSATEQAQSAKLINALLQQYNLSTNEGILLMCMAEALIRIPDKKTANAFIADYLSRANWTTHLNKSPSLLVNATTWGLLISGKVLHLSEKKSDSIIKPLLTKMGEPVIRTVIEQAMKILGQHFVIGPTIESALKNGLNFQKKKYIISFDMLGEAAITLEDAERYKQAYLDAIEKTSQHNQQYPQYSASSISVKLSSLYPRYEKTQETAVLKHLGCTLLEIIEHGVKHNVHITLDAEECHRLELSLKIFQQLFQKQHIQQWKGLGLAVQAYSKRALPVLMWLRALAMKYNTLIPVRLVKGAYWDNEIKQAQILGENSYPVYTRKESTDLSYLVCVRFLFDKTTNQYLFPQFASHNPHTIASILELKEEFNHFELQCLYGMGETIYDPLLKKYDVPVRIYAPVGAQKELLPYLMRRLLENGANGSFVNLLSSQNSIYLKHHPLHQLQNNRHAFANPFIPLPGHLFSDHKNSQGINILIESQWDTLSQEINRHMHRQYEYGPMLAGKNLINKNHPIPVYNACDQSKSIGTIYFSTNTQVEQALNNAYSAFLTWRPTPVDQRAMIIEKLADLIEKNRGELIALCHQEAGKTIKDSIDEIREAVDFCRYYSQLARKVLQDQLLTGPTGESNQLYLQGRGVFLCISPWNFPLAIFIGQVVAALITGNAVLAKPAEQTTLIAGYTVQLAWEAGIPDNVLQLIPGDGKKIGHQLLTDSRIAGVCFTGSTEVSQIINQQLAQRKSGIIPFIAETGGQNAMIVDSTALPEQVTIDIALSAFSSAGQRCSALRVLYLQEDIADQIIPLLKGVMNNLVVGTPSQYHTDIGPIIDENSMYQLNQHIKDMEKNAVLLARTPLNDQYHNDGYYIAPHAFQIKSIKQLEKEHFGPILHVITFKNKELDRVIDEINSTKFGLTLGINSRNESMTAYIFDRAEVGNVYINRNQIGAVVGVQPFGGKGLSGTGPKAGGPHYLYRFIEEKHKSVNTTAIGGNASLLLNSSVIS